MKIATALKIAIQRPEIRINLLLVSPDRLVLLEPNILLALSKLILSMCRGGFALGSHLVENHEILVILKRFLIWLMDSPLPCH